MAGRGRSRSSGSGRLRWPRRRCADRGFLDAVGRARRRRWPRGPARACWRWSRGRPSELFSWVYADLPAGTLARGELASEVEPRWLRSRWRQALNEALRRSLAEDDRDARVRRGRREARRRLPGHRRPAGRVRRAAASSTRRSPSPGSPASRSASPSRAGSRWSRCSSTRSPIPALNQVISHVAKYRNRSRGRVGMPIVIRIPFGGGIGGGREPLGLARDVLRAHRRTEGRRPVDRRSTRTTLLRASIADPDPVVFLEPKSRYWSKEDGDLDGEAGPPIGRARVVRDGSDCTVVAYGAMVPRALARPRKRPRAEGSRSR